MKRDAENTARNKQVAELTEQINELKIDVLKITGHNSEQSLNGTYGGKYADYIDIKNDVIETPEQFIALYFQGFLRTLEGLGIYARPGNAYYNAFIFVKKHKKEQEWLRLFLTRTFLKNYEALSKVRPKVEDAEIWIGQNNASYGILVTPRFRAGAGKMIKAKFATLSRSTGRLATSWKRVSSYQMKMIVLNLKTLNNICLFFVIP